MGNQFVEEAIRRILSRRGNGAPGMCPDENEFAAYLEARLTAAERARFEEHACGCSVCRGTLALSLRMAEEERTAGGEGSAQPRRTLHYSLSYLRFAMGAVFVLTVGVLLFQSTRNSGLFAPRTPVAGVPAQPETSVGAGAELRSREAEKDAAIPAKESGSFAARSKESTVPPSAERRAPVHAAKPGPAVAAAPAPPPALPELAPPQAAARTDAVKTGTVEAQQDVQKARPSQADASMLQAAAANLDEKKLQAEAGGQQVATQQKNEAVQAVLIQAGAEVTQAQPAKTAGPLQQALMEARQAWSGNAAVDSKVRAESMRKIGSRIFYRTTNYWVDAECARHVEAPQREVARDSKLYADMLAQEPALARLPADLPVLLYRDGTIFLIRPGVIKSP